MQRWARLQGAFGAQQRSSTVGAASKTGLEGRIRTLQRSPDLPTAGHVTGVRVTRVSSGLELPGSSQAARRIRAGGLSFCGCRAVSAEGGRMLA